MRKSNSKIINWDSVFTYSDSFQNNSPCKWAFIEEFFHRDFYEKLYKTFPQDNVMKRVSAVDKDSLRTLWGDDSDGSIPTDTNDPRLSDAWNEFHHYLFDEGFIKNIQKFSGVNVNKLKHFSMKISRAGDYQSAHIHNSGHNTIIFMIYFTKNWKQGEPGGTYITPEEDEEKRIFEPYNLDNSAIVFQDGPNAGHGVRPLLKGSERHAIQIYLEEYVRESDWTSNSKKIELPEI